MLYLGNLGSKGYFEFLHLASNARVQRVQRGDIFLDAFKLGNKELSHLSVFFSPGNSGS